MTAARWLLIIALAGGSTDVFAGACSPVKEYAQYKDKARTAEGRLSVAREYCLYDRLTRTNLPARELDECRSAQSKIMDALGGDKKAVKIALSGCPDIFGDPPPAAKICKYADAEGKIHYTQPPPEPGWNLLSCTSDVWHAVLLGASRVFPASTPQPFSVAPPSTSAAQSFPPSPS